jgi:PAS domain S-box-containing protein
MVVYADKPQANACTQWIKTASRGEFSLSASTSLFISNPKSRIVSDRPVTDHQMRPTSASLHLGTEVKPVVMSAAFAHTISQEQASLDTLPDMVYRVDEEGCLTYASAAIERLFGYTAEEAIGLKVFMHYVDPSKRNDFLQAMQDGHGEVANYDLEFYRKDGSHIWVSISARQLFDRQGNACGSEGIIRDIDQRKRDEQALVESKNLIQTLLDASSDAIMLFTPDGTLLSINSVMAQRFNTQATGLIGTSLWDLFPPNVSSARRHACDQVVASGLPKHTTDERHGRFFNNAIYPVINAQGNVDKIAVFSRDITNEVVAEEKIKRYVAEIEQSNRDLETFAFAASHDLREPLRMIGSFTDLLQSRYGHKIDNDGQEYLGFIRSGVERLGILIRDLLDYARIGQHEVSPTEIDMRLLLQRVWSDCQVTVTETKACLTLKDHLPTVFGYEVLIERLFSNLITNALRYRDPQRPLEISVGCDDEGVTWYVRDTGTGIDPQYHQKIFMMFQRLASGWQDNGSGLGLAIVQRVVERHNGRVWVESQLGAGSTFYLTLKSPRPLAGAIERPIFPPHDMRPES